MSYLGSKTPTNKVFTLLVRLFKLQTSKSTVYARTLRQLLGSGKVLEAHVTLALRARAT